MAPTLFSAQTNRPHQLRYRLNRGLLPARESLAEVHISWPFSSASTLDTGFLHALHHLRGTLPRMPLGVLAALVGGLGPPHDGVAGASASSVSWASEALEKRSLLVWRRIWGEKIVGMPGTLPEQLEHVADRAECERLGLERDTNMYGCASRRDSA